MGKFLKFNNALGVTSGESATKLIPVDQVAFVSSSGATTTDIVLPNGTFKYVVTTDQNASPVTATVEAIQSALTANPGGVVSTVTPPIGANGNRVTFRVTYTAV
tara:strand:+ start:125 stop:436 length:312 start_codon:yes stop_codon:yes gene_type:complete